MLSSYFGILGLRLWWFPLLSITICGEFSENHLQMTQEASRTDQIHHQAWCRDGRPSHYYVR